VSVCAIKKDLRLGEQWYFVMKQKKKKKTPPRKQRVQERERERGRDLPGIGHTDHVIHITQSEFEEFVHVNAACVPKAEKGVIRKTRSIAHQRRVKETLVG
jgi:hypothetical protein